MLPRPIREESPYPLITVCSSNLPVKFLKNSRNFDNRKQTQAAADMWSVGVVLFEMLSGVFIWERFGVGGRSPSTESFGYASANDDDGALVYGGVRGASHGIGE